MTTYRVTAPMITVPVASAARDIGSYHITGATAFYEGAVLPDDADPEHVARHLATGAIEAVEL